MAIKLTSGFQKVAEVSYKVTSNTTGYTRLYLRYGDTDIEKVTNRIYYEIRQYSYNPYGNYLGWGWTGAAPWHIKDVDKNKVYASGSYTQPEIYSNTGEVVRANGSFIVQHEDDGTWSDTINFSAYVYTSQLSINADISLPNIDRLAKITNAPTSMNDTDTTITFSYSNPANFKVQPQILITQDSSIGYEYDGYITANPFSWKWLNTAEDRERLYSALRTSTKATLSLRLKTYNASDTLLGMTSVDIPFELIDANPFVELETEEQNQKVKAIVNGNLIAVNYVSQIKSIATFSDGKGSTLKKISINGIEGNQSPFTALVKVEVDEPGSVFGVVASVEDSRTQTDADDVIYQLIDYRPVSINSFRFKRENPTSDQIYLNADIRYWQVTVNGIANTVNIYYSTDGQSYTEIPSTAYTIDSTNHRITISKYAVPTKLNYKNQGTYYLKVIDKFDEDNENEIVTKGIPVTEKGKDIFQVNGRFTVADEDRNTYMTMTKNEMSYNGTVNIAKGDSTKGYKQGGDVILRHNSDGATLLSSTATGIYLRPKGNTVTDGQVIVKPSGYIETQTGNVIVSKSSKNLYDYSKVAPGLFVVDNNQAINASTSYVFSGYIPVKPNTTYTRSNTGEALTIFMNYGKAWLSGTTSTTFTTPNDCCYIGFNIPVARYNDGSYTKYMVNEGSTLKTYEAYVEPAIVLRTSDGIEREFPITPKNENDWFVCGSIGDFQKYLVTNAVPPFVSKCFHLSLNGLGASAFVQKTSNTYQSFIYISYSGNAVHYKCLNGTWSATNIY